MPPVQGFEYRPRHDEDGLARVLFEEAAVLVSADPILLTSPEGLRVLRDALHLHNATVG